MKSEDYNFSFIYLVRDPRGIMNSRLRISKVQYKEQGKGLDIVKKLKAHCIKMDENAKFIINSPFWKERTSIVRYEDIAFNPKSFAKKIYKKNKGGFQNFVLGKCKYIIIYKLFFENIFQD
jgi:hypothetical protein